MSEHQQVAVQFAPGERCVDDDEIVASAQCIDQAAGGLFGKLEEFVSYPRLYFIANNADFGARPDLPAGAVVKGESVTLTSLFGIGKE